MIEGVDAASALAATGLPPGIAESLLCNEVFVGLVSGGLLITAIAFALRSLPMILWRAALRYLTCELEVQNNQPAFYWLAEWLAGGLCGRRAGRRRLCECTPCSFRER